MRHRRYEDQDGWRDQDSLLAERYGLISVRAKSSPLNRSGSAAALASA
jgi:hypothetical protein